MPLIETLPVGADTAQWTTWGTTARVVVTDPRQVAAAERLVRAELAAVDAACSRFRPDSELARLGAGGGRVSPLLAALVGAALQAARDTDGDVDPTLGGTMCTLGYDRDFASISSASMSDASLSDAAVSGVVVRVSTPLDWRRVRLALQPGLDT